MRIPFLFIFSLMCMHVSYAQFQANVDSLLQEADHLRRLNQFDESLALFDKIEPRIENNDYITRIKYHKFRFSAYRYTGSVEGLKRENDLVIEIIKENYDSLYYRLPDVLVQRLMAIGILSEQEDGDKTLAMFRDHLDQYEDPYGEAYYLRFLGLKDAMQGKWYAAIDKFENSLKFGGFYSKEDEVDSYFNLSFFYDRTSQYHKYEECVTKALDLLETIYPKNLDKLCSAYNRLYLYQDQSNRVNCQQAMNYAKELERLSKEIDQLAWNQKAHLALLNCNLGFYKLTREDTYLDKAHMLLDSITTLELQNDKNPTILKSAYNSMCNLYRLRNDTIMYKHYYTLSKAIPLDKNLIPHRFEIVRDYWFDTYNGKFEEAIYKIQGGFCDIINGFNACDDIHVNPTSSELRESKGIKLMYHKVLGCLNLYEHTKDVVYLEVGKKTWSVYDSIMTDIVRDNNKSLSNHYYAGVSLRHELFEYYGDEQYVIDGLYSAEKEKNMRFIMEVKKAYEINAYELPDSVAMKQSVLQEEFTLAERTVKKIALEDKEELAEAKIDLVNKQKLLNDYNFFVQEEFPQDDPPEMLDKLFKKEALVDYLQSFKDETIIEYSFTEDNLYALVLNGSTRNSVSLDVSRDEISSLVFDMNEKIVSQSSEYEKEAKLLYSYLIAPVKEYLDKENILIVPDGELALFPFGILQDGEGVFMISKWNIRHTQSLLWQMFEDSEVKEEVSGSILAIGASPDMPAFHQYHEDASRSELSHLPGANKEVNLLSEHFDGTFLTDNHAVESAFKSEAQNYKAIHLAMHGIMDNDIPEDSRLVFSQESDQDGYLHAYEIYNLDLNADLLTLSACNSGVGQINAGEGVKSIASAFAYAGCPNSIRSLWSVDDGATSKLMEQFYANVKSGMGKDESLTYAKRSYLANAQEYKKHPYYWGGFVYYGNNRPTEIAAKSPIKPIHVAAAVFGLCLVPALLKLAAL